MPAIVSHSGRFDGASGVIALGLRIAVAILLAQGPSGCNLICVDCGEGKSNGTQVISDPTVMVFDYRLSNSASGATYASGCGAAASWDDLSVAINVNMPLEVEYLLEITSIRAPVGKLSQELDGGYFCQLPYNAGQLAHVNPACYQTLPGSIAHELLEASVVDAAGNALASTAYEYVNGRSTDIENYKLRSHAYGRVEVSTTASPCVGNSRTRSLLTVHSP